MRKSKYDAIPELLESMGGETVEVTLDRIHQVVQGGLPSSAYTYEAWWANNDASGPGRQCHRWMQAGWRAYPKLDRGKVLFRRLKGQAAEQAQGQAEPANRDQPVRINVYVSPDDVQRWRAFRDQGGNASKLFSQALRIAVPN